MASLIPRWVLRDLAWLLAMVASLLVCGIQSTWAEDRDLLIVAGQSNAVGYDAKPGEIQSDEADRQILFWWRCGDPPPDDHDSTSNRAWMHLKPQPLGNPKRPKEGRQYGNFAQPEGGFGPEIGWARALYAKEQKPLAIVKVAFSGTSLTKDWNPNDSGDTGACYRALVAETKAAIETAKQQKGITLRPRALAWVQGESDANPEYSRRYAEDLGRMFAALRKELAAPELITLVAVNTQFGGGQNPFVPEIVEQQKRLGANDPRCEYVDTSSATIANAAHFDSKGTLLVGQYFAEALIAVEAELRPERRHFTIVTLGDSITKGVRPGVAAQQTFAALLESQLNQSGNPARVINEGIGGERTDQALKRLDQILARHPDLVTVMYGTNDSYVDQGKTASRISAEEYQKNLTKIVTELESRGIQVVLMTEPRWADDARPNGLGENPNVRLQAYLDHCRDIARNFRVPLVDHYAHWSKARMDGVKLREWTTDGCHPNPQGHEQLVQALLPVIEEATGPELTVRQKLLTGQPVRVVCFGDSVTGVYYHTGSRRAYADMLGIALRRFAPRAHVEIINAGISGHTTVNALARIEKDVLGKKPDLVTVMFGLNDMSRVPIEDYRANLRTIITQCQAAGSEVVLATPNNVIDTPARPGDKLIAYCDVVREVGRDMNVPVCDCYRELDAFRQSDASKWRLLMSDAIHPNMAGHKRIATSLAQTITGLRVSLEDVPPSQAALPKMFGLLKEEKPLSVLAMEPLDQAMEEWIHEHFPKAQVKVTSWKIEGQTLPQIEQDAKTRVRPMKPDLVMVAIPRSAGAETEEAFIHSYIWTMNSSLNFGPPTWDVVVVHPSVLKREEKAEARDDLIRRLVRGQDLPLIDRPRGHEGDASSILRDWLKEQLPAKPE